MNNSGSDIQSFPDPEQADHRGGRNAWIFAVFALSLASATLYVGNALNPFGPVKEFAFRTFSLVFVFLWLRDLVRGRPAPGGARADLPLVLLIAWSALSFLYTRSQALTLNSFVNLVCQVMLFFVVSRKITGPRAVEKLLRLTLVSALCACVFAFFDCMGKDVFPFDALVENRFYSLWKAVKPELGAGLGWGSNFDGRVSAGFGNPVYFAGYLLMSLPLAAAFFLSERRRGARVLLLLVFVVLLLCLVMTFTRWAWICFIVSAPAALLFLPRGTAGKMFSRGALRAAALVVVSLIAISPFVFRSPTNPPKFSIAERIRSLGDTRDKSFLERSLIWKTAWGIFTEHPVLGVGLGNYEVYHPERQARFFGDENTVKNASFPESPHNEYLELLSERGVPGLALFLASVAAILIPSMRRGRSATAGGNDPGEERPRLLAAGLGVGLISLLLYSFTQFPFRIVPVAAQFWVFAGALVALGRPKRVTPLSPERAGGNPIAAGLILVLSAAVFAALAYHVSAPLRASVLADWGIALGAEGKKEAGAELLQSAVDVWPMDQEILHYAGAYWMQAAHATDNPVEKSVYFKKALDALSRGVEINPNNTPVLNNLGVVLLSLGDIDGAMAVFGKIASLEPRPVNSLFNLGIAWHNKKMYNSAIEAFTRCLQLDSGNMQAYFNLARAYSAAGDYKSAENTLMNALAMEPNNMDMLNSLGQVYDSTERWDDAVSAYRAALKKSPRHFAIRGNLAISLIKSGDAPEAAEILTDLIKENSSSAAAHFHLAAALEAQGRLREAAEHYEKASEIEPDNPTYGAEKPSTWRRN